MEIPKIDENVFVMCEDYLPNLSVQDIKRILYVIKTEAELASLFSVVDNKAWWIADELYDFSEGTDEYKKAMQETKGWFCLAEELKKRIVDILKDEGIEIMKKGQRAAIEFFMERNGFKDGSGWWIRNSV